MADIDELFSRINKQAADIFSFFPHVYEETFDWINNYGEDLCTKIKAAQNEQCNLPILIKSPMKRSKNKPLTFKTRSLLKMNENTKSEPINSIKYERFRRSASIIAEHKIAYQSNCNLRRKLRRPDKNESILHDISNSATLMNLKSEKLQDLTSENIYFYAKNNEKENIPPSVIKFKNNQEKIEYLNKHDENRASFRTVSSFNSSNIIPREERVSFIMFTDSENEEEIKTPKMNENINIQVPGINRKNKRKIFNKMEDKNKTINELTKNVSPTKQNNSNATYHDKSISFMLSKLDLDETDNSIVTVSQCIEEINRSTVNSNFETNQHMSPSRELLKANDQNSELKIIEKCLRTSTPIKPKDQKSVLKVSNNQNICGLVLLQKINEDSPPELPDNNEFNISTNSLEIIDKTFIIENDTLRKDIVDIFNQKQMGSEKLIDEENKLFTSTHSKTKISDKENSKLQKNKKSPTKIHTSKIKNINVPVSFNAMKYTKTAVQLKKEEKQRKLLKKEEQAKNNREALIQMKIEEQRKKREEKQLKAKKVREEKKKQTEERLQFIKQTKEEEQQKNKIMQIEEAKGKTQKRRNINKIPLLPTGDCYDSDDSEGKVLKKYYVQPVWSKNENVTSFKITQDHLPNKCIKKFFRLPLIKPNLVQLFKNIQAPN